MTKAKTKLEFMAEVTTRVMRCGCGLQEYDPNHGNHCPNPIYEEPRTLVNKVTFTEFFALPVKMFKRYIRR